MRDYQCEYIREATVNSLNYLARYSLSTKKQRNYSLYNEKIGAITGLTPELIFQLTMHIPGCKSCSKEYERSLLEEISIRQLFRKPTPNETRHLRKRLAESIDDIG